MGIKHGKHCVRKRYVSSAVVTEFILGKMIGRCLSNLLDNSRMNEVDAIVVRNFSCIIRDHMKLLEFMKALEVRKVRIISLDEEVVEPASALWKQNCKNIK